MKMPYMNPQSALRSGRAATPARRSFQRLGGALLVLGSALLAACGGGGAGSPALTPTPGSVVALSAPRVTQSTTAQGSLPFRFAFNNPTYPVSISFTISTAGGLYGASCGGGAAWTIAPGAGVTVTDPGTGLITGTLTIASSAAARQISVIACPGASTANTTVTVNWTGGGGNGVASGTIRGSANTDLTNTLVQNDTGMTLCGNATTNNLPCPQSGFPGQDGESGRDTSSAVTGAGSTRTSSFALSATVAGDCLQDGTTGLTWEGKTTDGGLRDAANTYTWFNSSAASNGGASGTASGGTCTGSLAGCDTQKYVAAVNAAAVCGYTDWRLPTAVELATLVDLGRTSTPTSDPLLLNQRALPYWTGSPSASDVNGAWMVDFTTGAIGTALKSTAQPVRLVRGR